MTLAISRSPGHGTQGRHVGRATLEQRVGQLSADGRGRATDPSPCARRTAPPSSLATSAIRRRVSPPAITVA